MEDKLQERITSITQQLQQVTAQVLSLAEALTQAKGQASQLQGHLNEANFMLDEFRKYQDANKATGDHFHLTTENDVKLADLNYQEN